MMKIAFYIAKHGNFFDKLIAWWTRPSFWKFWKSGKYSHSEIVFSDGLCFSASQRENRTRFKWIDLNNGNWDLVDLDWIKEFEEKSIMSNCLREENKKYDWICIFFSFVFPFNLQERNKWTCSEVCAELVLRLNKSFKYSPNSLSEKLKILPRFDK